MHVPFARIIAYWRPHAFSLAAFFLCVAGIIASKRCNNVEISNNEVYNGGENAAGIFLHRSSDNAQVFGELLRFFCCDGTLLSELRVNVLRGCLGRFGSSGSSNHLPLVGDGHTLPLYSSLPYQK